MCTASLCKINAVTYRNPRRICFGFCTAVWLCVMCPCRRAKTGHPKVGSCFPGPPPFPYPQWCDAWTECCLGAVPGVLFCTPNLPKPLPPHTCTERMSPFLDGSWPISFSPAIAPQGTSSSTLETPLSTFRVSFPSLSTSTHLRLLSRRCFAKSRASRESSVLVVIFTLKNLCAVYKRVL